MPTRLACALLAALTAFSLGACHTANDGAATPARLTSLQHPIGQVDPAAAAGDARKEALLEFQSLYVRPTGGLGFRLRENSEFFTLDWESPTLAAQALGEYPMKARWFDAGLREVKRAGGPGRYAVVLEGRTPDGMLVRRGRTFYARPADWRPELQPLPRVTISHLPGGPIPRQVWEEHAPHFTRYVAGEFVRGLMMEEEGAILLAGLSEMRPLGRAPLATERPEVLHDEHHLAIKRLVMGLPPTLDPLPELPRKLSEPAPVLRAGSPREAGVHADTAARLQALCREWYARSGEPFVTLVARNGVIIYHEAVGSTFDGPVPLDARYRVASITKTLCGQMFAQFMEQGLIGLDDPVGRYFPEFPATGDRAVTLRHCFTHTTGLDGHGVWGGMRNPYLENVIANGIEYLQPGRVHRYNGMGYDLAAKVMEVVSGKSFVRLFHEHYFRPLGMAETPFFDLGFSAELSALDLAKAGQLMANRGAYGDLHFYSPATFDRLLPRPLAHFYPALMENKDWKDLEWGAGLVWMREPRPDGNGWLLGRKVIGHGSASGCILRVDLDHGLVIAQVRSTSGDHYFEYVQRFIQILDESLDR